MHLLSLHAQNAPDTVISNTINEIQHTQTIQHPGHLAFHKIYSRVDYTRTFLQPFQLSRHDQNYYNAEFGYSLKAFNAGFIYNYTSKFNSYTNRYSGLVSAKILSGKLTWLVSGGFHYATKALRLDHILFIFDEPALFKVKDIFYHVSFSNLFIYQKLFFSATFSDVNDYNNGYVHNLLGYHFTIHNLQLTPGIHYSQLIYDKYPEEDIYYDTQPLAINLSAIYKEYIAGLSFNGNKYTFSAGYHAFKNILFNINYTKTIYDYVDFFKISLIYHH